MSKLVGMYERDDRAELCYPGGDRTEELACDVAVVGGGGSGLSAAVRAAQLGARVVLVEKMDALGGNTQFAGGLLSTTSRYQRALGLRDRTDDYIKQAYSLHGYTLDPRIFRRYIQNTGKYFEWLADLGLDLENIRYVMDSVVMIKNRLEPGPLNNPAYGPGLMGSNLIGLLKRQLEPLNVDLRLSAKVTKLLTDETGAVCGLLADGQDGKLKISAGAVVLASGGFGGNTALLKRFLPQYFSSDNYFSHYCMLYTTGDGLLMAEDVGAEVGQKISVGLEALTHVPGAYSIQRASSAPFTLMVNKDGRRFVAEDDTEDAEFAVDMQPEGLVYQIFDADTRDRMHQYVVDHARYGDRIPSLEEFKDDLAREMGEGKTMVADRLGDLAKFIGCDEQALLETVSRYNGFCEAGYDGELLKAPENLAPVRKGPFCAVLLMRKFDVTMGGVSVDHHLRAVRPGRAPIPGLYAAGDLASGWMGEEYGPLFSSFAWAANSGYLAGEEAAQGAGGR